MLWGVEGSFYTDNQSDSIEVSVEDLAALSGPGELNNLYSRIFSGGPSFQAKIGDSGLENTPFEMTLRLCEEWEQFDENDEITISNGEDGFSVEKFDLSEVIHTLPADETLSLGVRFSCGFRIAVVADSADQATSILRDFGPKHFVIEDDYGQQWVIDEIRVAHCEKINLQH